jgi:vacuolar-type H+-ATPase subunit F/Vma7
MQIPDEIRLGIELITFAAGSAVILLKLGGMGVRFDQHSEALDKMQSNIDKIEETLQVVAVQKDQIQSIREMIQLNTKRTDETFTRIFNTLDRAKPGPQ